MNESLSAQKSALRKDILSKRDRLDFIEKASLDESLTEHLIEWIEANEPNVVHCYLPMGSEPDLFPFLQWLLLRGTKVICPQTLPDRTLAHWPLHNLDELEHGMFQTSHPKPTTAFTGKIDLIIVPGLAFSAKGTRLGYGGGYYDQFVTQHKEAKTIAVGYPFQIVDQLPADQHDISVGQIILPWITSCNCNLLLTR